MAMRLTHTMSLCNKSYGNEIEIINTLLISTTAVSINLFRFFNENYHYLPEFINAVILFWSQEKN